MVYKLQQLWPLSEDVVLNKWKSKVWAVSGKYGVVGVVVES